MIISCQVSCYMIALRVWILCFSKQQSDAVREAISPIAKEASEKQRKFTETIELQIGLKNYDPQKDKHFSGSVKLPHIPRPKMKVCMLGDAQHVEEVNLSSWWCFWKILGLYLLFYWYFNPCYW